MCSQLLLLSLGRPAVPWNCPRMHKELTAAVSATPPFQAVEGAGAVGTYKPYVRSVRIKKDKSGYESLAQCEVDFELTHENKVS